jgi:hypothetical protein
MDHSNVPSSASWRKTRRQHFPPARAPAAAATLALVPPARADAGSLDELLAAHAAASAEAAAADTLEQSPARGGPPPKSVMRSTTQS